MRIEIKKLNPAVTIPKYGTAFSGAVDLQAAVTTAVTVYPSQNAILIPTGIAVNMGCADMAAILLPRSGFGHRLGLALGNTVGFIDSDYHGEIQLSVWNRSPNVLIIQPFERIAQMVFIPIIRAEFELVDTFSCVTDRGAGGFGSTGT